MNQFIWNFDRVITLRVSATLAAKIGEDRFSGGAPT